MALNFKVSDNDPGTQAEVTQAEVTGGGPGTLAYAIAQINSMPAGTGGLGGSGGQGGDGTSGGTGVFGDGSGGHGGDGTSGGTSGGQGGDGTSGGTGGFGGTPVCFTTGTLIRTTRGDVAVEHLVVGDLVVTASGAHRPIRWLGHRTIDCRKRPGAANVMPIRVTAHAFGAGGPARDICLSPGHPVLVGAAADGDGGYLVPIMCLINGTTIERFATDEVTYWHIELDGHDILLAENLPVESYIDLGSRPWFAGAEGALYDPDMALPSMSGRCRPVAIDGPIVEAERRRLDAVFATRLQAACTWPCFEDLPARSLTRTSPIQGYTDAATLEFGALL